MNPLFVLGSGMVTGVGFSTESSCAAVRAGITGFVETGFVRGDAPVIGSPIPSGDCDDHARLIAAVTRAIADAIATCRNADAGEVLIFVGVGEASRPGRVGTLDESILSEIAISLGIRLHPKSCVIREGRLSGIRGIQLVTQAMNEDATLRYAVVAGVDSLLTAESLSFFDNLGRLFTGSNSDGFIAGEAACAVALGSKSSESSAMIEGLGFGDEPATPLSREPLRAEGLRSAILGAIADANLSMKDIAYRLTDNSGEQYGFKESALAIARTLRPVKAHLDAVQPADCVGEVGAAFVPILVAISSVMLQKSYGPDISEGDRVLIHCSAMESRERVALIVAPTNDKNSVRRES